MCAFKNLSWRRLSPFAPMLIMAVVLCAASSRAMIPGAGSTQPSSAATGTGLRILGFQTAALLRYATQVLWPPELIETEEATAHENFIAQRTAELEALRAHPRIDLNELITFGNVARLDESRLIILNEDPLEIADITRIMLFLRDTAHADDAIVIETEGAHTLTLENLYLMRRMVLEQMRQSPENADYLLSRAQRRERRRQLVEELSPLLLGVQGRLEQHNVIPQGAQLYTFAPFGNLGITQGEDGIRAQTAAQMATVEEALSRHRRVFLVRNRAFSPYFFGQYLRRYPNFRLTLEQRYQCTLNSADDIINCETFWLFRLLGSLHSSLSRVSVMEFLPDA